MTRRPIPLLLLAILASSLACNLPLAKAPTPAAEGVETAIPVENIDPPPTVEVPIAIPTSTATPSPTLTATLTPTPLGCLAPPDDYTRIPVYPDIVVSQRTLFMLQHAQNLYGGSHDLVAALTQGSYSPGLEASFGTHDGGGAVDIAVRDLNDWNHILFEDLPAIILALRQAGFAAWVREQDELYPGSPIHIHAIAVGDADLSQAALRQLTGPEGYFRGFNGLPVDPPVPDKWGEPVLCPWMIELGYTDLREK